MKKFALLPEMQLLGSSEDGLRGVLSQFAQTARQTGCCKIAIALIEASRLPFTLAYRTIRLCCCRAGLCSVRAPFLEALVFWLHTGNPGRLPSRS
jgi:hypothetical protein